MILFEIVEGAVRVLAVIVALGLALGSAVFLIAVFESEVLRRVQLFYRIAVALGVLWLIGAAVSGPIL